MKNIKQKTHSSLEGFQNIDFVKPTIPDKSNLNLGKRESNNKASESTTDKTSKKLKSKHDTVHLNHPEMKALSATAGIETQMLNTAKTIFIKQAPITFNFMEKYKINAKIPLSPPNEPTKQ